MKTKLQRTTDEKPVQDVNKWANMKLSCKGTIPEKQMLPRSRAERGQKRQAETNKIDVQRSDATTVDSGEERPKHVQHHIGLFVIHLNGDMGLGRGIY